MRIGLDILYEKPELSTGTATYLQGFLKALEDIAGDKHQLFLFANLQSLEFCRKYAPNYKTIIVPLAGRGRAVRAILQFLLMPFYIKKFKLDVINFLGTTGSTITGCATVQHVKTFHHYVYPESLDYLKVIFLRLMLKPCLHHADVVIANSAYTKTGIIERMGVFPDKIVTISEAVDHSLFYPHQDTENCYRTLGSYGITRPYVLFVSTLWRYKNFETLIRAFSHSNIEHDLVVIGGVPDSQYRDYLFSLIRAYGIDNRVKMVGHISDRHIIRDFYIGANLYISPSYEETFGLTILESMACGTPVIASNTAAIPEVAGKAAILFDPHKYKELATCIRQVLSDSELKNNLVQKGLKRAKTFRWEKTAKATLKAYELSYKCFMQRRCFKH